MVGNDERINPKSRVNLSLLPPCVDAHHPHVDHVNHHVALFKRSNIPIYDAQKPHERQGWEKHSDLLEPIRSYGPILLPSLIDLLDKTLDEDVDSDNEDITDYDELISYLDVD